MSASYSETESFEAIDAGFVFSSRHFRCLRGTSRSGDLKMTFVRMRAGEPIQELSGSFDELGFGESSCWLGAALRL